MDKHKFDLINQMSLIRSDSGLIAVVEAFWGDDQCQWDPSDLYELTKTAMLYLTVPEAGGLAEIWLYRAPREANTEYHKFMQALDTVKATKEQFAAFAFELTHTAEWLRTTPDEILFADYDADDDFAPCGHCPACLVA